MFLSYFFTLGNEDKKKYRAAKNELAEEVIDRLEKFFGDFKSKVEVIDVATPATYVWYTNNWKGRFMIWALKPKKTFCNLISYSKKIII